MTPSPSEEAREDADPVALWPGPTSVGWWRVDSRSARNAATVAWASAPPRSRPSRAEAWSGTGLRIASGTSSTRRRPPSRARAADLPEEGEGPLVVGRAVGSAEGRAIASGSTRMARPSGWTQTWSTVRPGGRVPSSAGGGQLVGEVLQDRPGVVPGEPLGAGEVGQRAAGRGDVGVPSALGLLAAGEPSGAGRPARPRGGPSPARGSLGPDHDPGLAAERRVLARDHPPVRLPPDGPPDLVRADRLQDPDRPGHAPPVAADHPPGPADRRRCPSAGRSRASSPRGRGAGPGPPNQVGEASDRQPQRRAQQARQGQPAVPVLVEMHHLVGHVRQRRGRPARGASSERDRPARGRRARRPSSPGAACPADPPQNPSPIAK